MLTILPNKPHRPLLTICNDQLHIDVAVEPPAEDFTDNVRIEMSEECHPEWKMFKTDGIAFSLTSDQARTLAQALLASAEQNDKWLAKKRTMG